MICPELTIPFAGKKDVKAVFRKVQIPPLLRQVMMRPSGYFISPRLALGAI